MRTDALPSTHDVVEFHLQKAHEPAFLFPFDFVELQDAVEEVESCSACYGYLIPALDRLKEEGLLQELHEKICIGQGYRGKSGALGVGSCTSGFACNLKGCPPTDEQMYEFLKQYIATRRKTEAEK